MDLEGISPKLRGRLPRGPEPLIGRCTGSAKRAAGASQMTTATAQQAVEECRV
jgi:hypothetical protein